MSIRQATQFHAASARRQAGFTLIELLIAIVVVGVLTSIALPEFMNSIRKGRRAEAIAALSAVQQTQERYRGNNTTYTTTLADLTGIQSNVVSQTPSAYYTIALSASPDTGALLSTAYVATATAVSTSSQAKDTQCARMAVKVSGGNITYAGCGTCTSFTTADFSTSNACWAR